MRFVALNDSVDSAEGENEFAPFRNIMNERYILDASKKIRMSHRICGNAGEPLSQPPYGYTKDSDNPKRWVIDEQAAEVVWRIYDMCIAGFGVDQIGGVLEKEKILTPLNYWKRRVNAKENQLIFEGVHEPIIDREIWERVQQKRGKVRTRQKQTSGRNMFSGLLVCATCSKNLNYHFNQGNHDIQYFNCSNCNNRGSTCDITHYIRVDFLIES